MKAKKTRSYLLGLGLAVAFIVGCAASQVASQIVVKPARAGTNPQKWEYYCIRGNATTDGFNKLGAEGWELTAGGGAAYGTGKKGTVVFQWCFKRPL